MGQSTKENMTKKLGSGAVKVFKFGLMAQDTKDTGNLTKQMDKGD